MIKRLVIFELILFTAAILAIVVCLISVHYVLALPIILISAIFYFALFWYFSKGIFPFLNESVKRKFDAGYYIEELMKGGTYALMYISWLFFIAEWPGNWVMLAFALFLLLSFNFIHLKGIKRYSRTDLMRGVVYLSITLIFFIVESSRVEFVMK